MLYVSKKSGNDFEVRDTENKDHCRYTHDELKVMYDRGITIKGCAYIEGAFTVTPVPPVYGGGKEALAKALLTTGSATGIKGLNLKVEGDKITLLSFTEEFLKYAYDNSDDGRFVLTLPDLVNDIESGFCYDFDHSKRCNDSKKNLFICIDFPDSYNKLRTDVVFPYDTYLYVNNYGFTIKECKWGILDSIGEDKISEDDNEITSIVMGSLNTVTIKAKKLGCFSLKFLNNTRINLPNTEVLCRYAFHTSEISGVLISVVLGRCIRFIDNFMTNYTNIKDLDNRSLMERVTLVYLPDNCNLEKIDFTSAKYPNDTSVYPYVFIMSDYECNRFKSRLKSGELIVDLGVVNAVIGVLTYSDNANLAYIQKIFEQDEIYNYKFFSRYLTLKDIGSIVYMKLKYDC